jgi:Flp pilus assembly protein TadG
VRAHPPGAAVADEDGSVSAEVVVAAPALMLLILLAVQFGLWYHASNVARAASREGVRAARVEGATAADGEAEARHFLAEAGSTILGEPEVRALRDADAARVEVRGTAVSVVPGVRPPVRASSESPIERFHPPIPESRRATP